jgi:DNA (cytosine-5)-methyltransferase 1
MYSLGKKVFPVDTHVHTICERMGFIESGLNHKIAQERLAEMFPKKYRYSLHVNMVAHGREVCHERGKPLCHDCYLKKFCLYFRKTARKKSKGVSMVDLFCGAGGGSLGFIDAGFGVKFAVDNNVAATDTYYLNRPELSFDEVLRYNIKDLDRESLRERVKEKIVLVFGGPPCQGWSNTGKNRKRNGNQEWNFLEDEKNKLYIEFLKGLDAFQPRFFVMENVPGLMTAHKGKYAAIIEVSFLEHNYMSQMILLNASDYGIAQNRERIFFLGRRIYENEKLDFAKKELDAIIELIRKKKTDRQVSFRRAMVGLPYLKPGEGANVLRFDGMKIQGNGELEDDAECHLVFSHFARRHNSRDLEIYELLREGENYEQLHKRIDRKDLRPYSMESFNTKYRKISGNDPCYTIVSHLSRDANSYVHPDDNRGITVREATRIQSFPDDYIFLEKGYKQFILVGDAVPPILARVIGDAMIEVIRKQKIEIPMTWKQPEEE